MNLIQDEPDIDALLSKKIQYIYKNTERGLGGFFENLQKNREETSSAEIDVTYESLDKAIKMGHVLYAKDGL